MTLQLDIVTPDKSLFSGQVDFVSVPLEGGELGVLTGASPVMGTCGRGKVHIKGAAEDNGGAEQYYAISGGYAENDGEKVVVLANQAINISEIDKVFADKRITDTKAELAALPEDDLRCAFLQDKIAWQEYLLTLI